MHALPQTPTSLFGGEPTQPATQTTGWTSEDVNDAYMNVITDAITNHPRSQQLRIGPSEIGQDCTRRILYKLAEVPEPVRPPAWKPTIGTAVHAWLEEQFENARKESDAWVTEWPVTVGHLPDGTPITGSSDLYHRPSGTVIDHKIIGNRQLANYRANGPSTQYRIQAHLYAKGFTDSQEWEPAKHVAISFLPRDGELAKAYWWTEPYNPAIALQAIDRLHKLWKLLEILGLEATINSQPECDSPWCPWCVRSRTPSGSLFQ